MSRRHYVYYRVAQADLAVAVAAVGAVQAALKARHAGLGAELLRRPGARDGAVTLMEVWIFDAGHDAQAIETEAAAASQRWCRDGRHLEVFEPLS